MGVMRQTRIVLNFFFWSPYTALSCSALFWAGNFIVGRAIKGEIDPIPLNFLRWILALLLLLPLTMTQLIRFKGEIKLHWKLISALGFTGIAAFHTSVYVALVNTSAINALIILSISPAVIVCGSSLIFKEKVKWYQGLGLLLSSSGVLVLICRGDLEILMNLGFNRGDIWMVLAALLWSIYSILLKNQPDEIPHLVFLTSCVIAGLVMMTPLFLYSLLHDQILHLNQNTALSLFYIAIFSSVIAFLFWNYGVAEIGPARSGMFIHFMPFFGTILSILFLNDEFSTFHIFGTLLVGLGIYFSSKN